MNLKYSGTFPIYKKKAAAQLSIIRPRVDDSGKLLKEGSVLLEVAPAQGEKSYDWSKKISFAISRSDIVLLMDNPSSPQRIFHVPPSDPNKSKSLEFVPGEGRYTGTYMMKISQSDKSSDVNMYYTVPVSAGEYYCIQSLLMGSLRYLIGWQLN